MTRYSPTTWQSAATPVSAGNLNNIEDGIVSAAPIGSIVMWPLDDPPVGWLTLDGATVSRATHAELWDFVDTNGLAGSGLLYGEGDGTTTFVLPDISQYSGLRLIVAT